VREILKLQENGLSIMYKLIVMDGKMNSLMESRASTSNREPDELFLPEPLKELADLKSFENLLLDPDNYYKLVTPIYFTSCLPH